MYYLTFTAKRSNGKRNIRAKGVDLEYLRELGRRMSSSYIVEIYDGKWDFVEEVSKK